MFLLLLSFVLAQSAYGQPNPPIFDCPSVPAPAPATKVTQLHPGNIKVVMAVGDSISAGFAMKGWPAEYRGLVFSMGGDKYVSDFSDDLALTIPNFLKHYSPNLNGQSFGESVPLTKGTYLNGAVSGAKVEDLPGQIDYVVYTATTTYKNAIDWQNDWKLLTIFIGANNLCISCESNRGSPKYFQEQLDAAISQIQKTIPRVFVNVITIFNISGVWVAGQTKEYCEVIWEDLGVDECPCLIAHGDSGRQTMDNNAMAYNSISQVLAQKYSSQNTGNSNFTVVVQPGLSGYNISLWGETVLSDLDCFHPNWLANAAFSLSIWNNMFQPIGHKANNLDPNNIEFICPTVTSVLQ